MKKSKETVGRTKAPSVKLERVVSVRTEEETQKLAKGILSDPEKRMIAVQGAIMQNNYGLAAYILCAR